MHVLAQGEKQKVHQIAFAILNDIGAKVDRLEIFDLLCQIAGKGDEGSRREHHKVTDKPVRMELT